jgi:hypothetical protein
LAINYNPRIITDGLVLCLDAANPKSYGGSGTTWTDLSGRGNTGTLVNGVGYVGTNGGALSFDGVNDYVTLTNTASLRPGSGDFAIEAWIYKSGAPGGGQTNVTILGTMWSGGTPTGSWLFDMDGGNIRFLIWNAIIVQNTTPILTERWYHVAVSRIGTTFNLYINGILESTATSSLNANNSIYPIYIGRYYDPSAPGYNGYFNGKIPVVRLYNNRGLTASEVKQNYNATKSRYGL